MNAPTEKPAPPSRNQAATARKPSLAILIVNWNSKDYVRKCLESIEATARGRVDEIIVVDGASFDGCEEMLAREFPEVQFVQCQENVGFGRANNIGARHATSELLLLLNPDTELAEGALETMVDEFLSLPDCGLAGPRLLNSDGSLQTSCVQAFPTPLNQLLGSELTYRLFPGSGLWGHAHAFRAKAPVGVEAVSGACMLLRTETFREVAGFGAEYFMYGEDLDLCAKIAALGMKVYHIPEAEVTHHGGGCSARQTSRFSAVLLRESNFRFISTYQGKFAAWLYRAVMAASALLRLGLLAPAKLLTRGRRRESCAAALSKWTAVLRWALGLERWAAEKSKLPAQAPAPLAREGT